MLWPENITERFLMGQGKGLRLGAVHGESQLPWVRVPAGLAGVVPYLYGTVSECIVPRYTGR